MISFLFSAAIMLMALIMTVALWRSRSGDRDNYSRAINLALSTVPAILYRETGPIHDDAHKFTFLNDKIEEVLGYSPEELESDQKTMFRLMHPDDRRRFSSSDRLLMTMNPQTVLEHRFRHKNGEYRWLRRHVMRIGDEQGNFKELIGCAFDVTDLKEAEAKLWQAQKMEAVGQLAGSVVHDFNNMLSVIVGNLELLDATELDEFARQCIDEAIGGADRASELTRRLLAFSARQTLSPKVTNVNDLIDGLEIPLRRALGEEITLTIGLADDLWPVRIDTSQLENSLVNLAINARDVLPSHGQLTIETSNCILNEEYAARYADVTPGDYVQIVIRDNGIGIEKDVLPNIFDPFFTTEDTGQGTTIKIYIRRYSSKTDGGSNLSAKDKDTPTGDERNLGVEDNELVRETEAT